MIDRICISVNNRCNLRCSYCHFNEKEQYIEKAQMNVFKILDNVIEYINKYNAAKFKIGFVGNGEPLLDFDLLKEYILYIADYLEDETIAAYTITNGLCADKEKIKFFIEHNVTVGFSVDGIKEIHDKLRCNSYDTVMKNIELYYTVSGKYPPLNCTVGYDVLKYADETIAFFEQFGSRITFSRMIGKYGIRLDEFRSFAEKAASRLDVRTGGYDCTMYGGKCGAGINNLFYANDRIYVCGNCIDKESPFSSDTPLDKVDFGIKPFDRNHCYREMMLK